MEWVVRMYAEGNPKSAKELREWVAAGKRVAVFSPGPYPAPKDGRCTIEGPHYPKPHKFYVPVDVKDGVIVKVHK